MILTEIIWVPIWFVIGFFVGMVVSGASVRQSPEKTEEINRLMKDAREIVNGKTKYWVCADHGHEFPEDEYDGVHCPICKCANCKPVIANKN